jgi:hypothetical protein
MFDCDVPNGYVALQCSSFFTNVKLYIFNGYVSLRRSSKIISHVVVVVLCYDVVVFCYGGFWYYCVITIYNF